MVRYALYYRDQAVPLPLGRFVIGRSPGSELTINDRMVSRHHVVLHVTDTSIDIEDCGSRNGATINGVRLGGRQALLEGDLIRIGRHELRLTTSEARKRSRRPTAMSVTRKVRPYRQPSMYPADGTTTVDDVSQAISAGEYEEADAALRRILEWLRPRVHSRPSSVPMLAQVTKAAIEFGDDTGIWQPMEKALSLYQLSGIVPPEEIVAGIERRMDTLPSLVTDSIRALAASLPDEDGSESPDLSRSRHRLVRMSEPPEGIDDPTLVSS